MNTDWSDQMTRRLRAAVANPPTADVLRPEAEQAARTSAMRVAQRGGNARVNVTASARQVRVEASGPASGAILRQTAADLRRRRPQLVAAVQAKAREQLRSS